MKWFTWLDRNETWLWGIITLIMLLFVWPNFVHEPLHWMTLKLFGGEAKIVFDLTNWPAQPYTIHYNIPSIFAGVMYRIVPSLFSVGLLFVLWFTRHKAALLTHVVLPLYLTFDLIINLLGRASPSNDFHFLTLLHPFFTLAIMFLIMLFGFIVIRAGILDEVEESIKKRKIISSEERAL